LDYLLDDGDLKMAIESYFGINLKEDRIIGHGGIYRIGIRLPVMN
jgi:hypothetical protein